MHDSMQSVEKYCCCLFFSPKNLCLPLYVLDVIAGVRHLKTLFKLTIMPCIFFNLNYLNLSHYWSHISLLHFSLSWSEHFTFYETKRMKNKNKMQESVTESNKMQTIWLIPLKILTAWKRERLACPNNGSRDSQDCMGAYCVFLCLYIATSPTAIYRKLYWKCINEVLTERRCFLTCIVNTSHYCLFTSLVTV